MDRREDPPDDRTAAFDPTAPPRSVLNVIGRKTGEAPRVSLSEEGSATTGSPVIDPQSAEKSSLPQGRGSYQLMGEIARGGMGVVLKGHDTDLGRDVALKVLHRKLADRPESLQRFVEEAQIGGQLQHPGIVPVYELGLMADERPYFTMKLVKGRTLATLLAERKTPESDRRHFLDVFEAVCQTMAYAHSRGVIHRDLKPANVMVGAFGEVQVVDWGLAKVLARGGVSDERRADLARSSFTVLETVRSPGSGGGSDSLVGSVMGTPAYMPPEQASGQVDRLDERSDVFSLGAILCEILTGAPPYPDEERAISDAARGRLDDALARVDASGADPELVDLTKDCLLAAPAARPRNAGVVAERVHEHIVSVEERARAAQIEVAAARVKAAEERRARKLTAGLAVAVVAILALGGGGWVFVQNERAARERETAARERETAAREREAAERQRVVAAGVSEALAEASHLRGQARWTEAFAAVDRARALAEGGAAGEDTLARVAAVRADIQRDADETRLREERARANERLLADLHEVRHPSGEEQAVVWYGELDRTYARVFQEHGIDLDAGTVEQAAQALLSRGLDADVALHLDDWMEARHEEEDEPGATRLLDLAHRVDPDPIRADVREAVATGDADALLWLADSGLEDQPPTTLSLLGTALENAGLWERALGVFEDGLGRYPDNYLLHWKLARLYEHAPNDGTIPLERTERRERAIPHYWAALALDPQSTAVRHYLGIELENTGRPAAAAKTFLEWIAIDPDHGHAHYHLGRAYAKAGAHGEAAPALERALELGPGGGRTAESYALLGVAYRETGRPGRAAESFVKALEVDPSDSRARSGLASLLLASGDVDAAHRILEDLESDDGEVFNNLAWQLALGANEEVHRSGIAVDFGRRAVELDPGVANYRNTLGVACYYAGDFEGAVESLRRAVELSGGGDPYDWLFLAMAHRRLGDEQEARRWYERSIGWMVGNPDEDAELDRFRAEAEALFGGGEAER